jgi:hypothetical protein
MGTRPRRQQTAEKIGAPLELGFGTVHVERRNGSPILSARAYIQGKHKVWSTGETDEKATRRKATDDFFKLHRRIAQGEQLHGHLLSEAVEKFLDYADASNVTVSSADVEISRRSFVANTATTCRAFVNCDTVSENLSSAITVPFAVNRPRNLCRSSP